jgi:hypothetical protein
MQITFENDIKNSAVCQRKAASNEKITNESENKRMNWYLY